MSAPDVVVIGGGVIGASIAFHLARRGANVTVLERGAGRGAGSTGRATGGFRAQYETEINIRLSLLSRDKLNNFANETGVDSGYRPAGYLWLAADQGQLDALSKAQALQHRLGLTEARMLSTTEIAALQPFANLENVAGAAFCPTDGYIRPMAILNGYLDAAVRLGAKVQHLSPVEELSIRGGRIESVRAAGRKIPVGAVVDAGGAWAAQVAALAGIDLPVTPLRRQIAVTLPQTVLPELMPMTIWLSDGFHLRVRDGRALLLMPSPGDADPFLTGVDELWLSQVERLAKQRLPALEAVRIDRAACTAGLYEMSPDRHALVGPTAGVANFFLACGSSGHGVMHAPALGQIVAEQILDGKASVLDVGALRPERFAEGQPNSIAGLL